MPLRLPVIVEMYLVKHAVINCEFKTTKVRVQDDYVITYSDTVEVGQTIIGWRRKHFGYR